MKSINLPLRIFYDIDDTLVDFLGAFSRKFPQIDLSISSQITKGVYKLRHDKNFWENLEPIELPVGEIAGYCTKRINSKVYTRNCLIKLGLPTKPIYQVYSQSANKANYIRGHCDVLIDDSARNVIQALNIGFPAILIDRPHNQQYTNLPRVYHLHYDEILEVYKTLINER